jgi:hypothetical protein
MSVKTLGFAMSVNTLAMATSVKTLAFAISPTVGMYAPRSFALNEYRLPGNATGDNCVFAAITRLQRCQPQLALQ